VSVILCDVYECVSVLTYKHMYISLWECDVIFYLQLFFWSAFFFFSLKIESVRPAATPSLFRMSVAFYYRRPSSAYWITTLLSSSSPSSSFSSFQSLSTITIILILIYWRWVLFSLHLHPSIPHTSVCVLLCVDLFVRRVLYVSVLVVNIFLCVILSCLFEFMYVWNCVWHAFKVWAYLSVSVWCVTCVCVQSLAFTDKLINTTLVHTYSFYRPFTQQIEHAPT